MRILVTRPQPAAEATAERLRALGHQPVLLSLFAAEADPAAATVALQSPHAAIAVTSAQAARTLALLGGDLSPHLGTSVHAVGAATATAMEGLGFENLHIAEGTGDSLATALLQRQGERPEQLLYLTGKPRSPDFESRLAAAGMAVQVAEIYRMVPVADARETLLSILTGERPEIVLLYSTETARHVFSLIAGEEHHVRSSRFLCLSPRIAAQVPEMITRVEVAARPDEDSLLALI